jgi:hypothetical protein
LRTFFGEKNILYAHPPQKINKGGSKRPESFASIEKKLRISTLNIEGETGWEN